MLSDVAANAAANAVTSLLADGYLRLYDGQRMLAELRFASPAFDAAIGGTAQAQAIRRDFAGESGIASRFRAFAGDGQTVVLEGSIGLMGSGADLRLTSVEIAEGAEVTISGFDYTQSRG